MDCQAHVQLSGTAVCSTVLQRCSLLGVLVSHRTEVGVAVSLLFVLLLLLLLLFLLV